MTETFEETLRRVVSHQSVLRQMEERGIESSVIVPLLRQVGWNEYDFTEIFPQWGITKINKRVDYNLRIEGQSKIFVEVKQWGHALDDYEKQLEEYCQHAIPKPKLAVLTSGQVWRLYLSPTASKGKNSYLKKFLEIDITSTPPAGVERDFRLFLTRDGMVNPKAVLDKASALNRELEDFRNFKSTVTNALREASSNEDVLHELILALAEKRGISTSDKNVSKLTEDLMGSIQVEIAKAKPSQKKPASFTLITKPDSKSVHRVVRGQKGWRYFLVAFCELMRELHSENFHGNILSLPKRFSVNEDAKNFTLQIGDSGVYAMQHGKADDFREDCNEILTKFGYERDDLEIRDNKGEVL